MTHRAPSLAVALLGLAAAPALAAQLASVRDLADLSLEQLASVEVTSVSGRPENLQEAAASIYVITAQEIRRSAATSLPEALRLAPNLQAAQTSAGQWAVSARGFQDAISNKLLVLIDGRTVYSPLFAGVFWDANDVVLEDVERIEVISGPGGTLWGANAVNGIINVVTRHASHTQGTLLSVARSGNGGREVARWGTRLGNADVRVYGIATDLDNTRLPSGAERPDASSRVQAGFRADWEGGEDTLTLQGDAYRGGDPPANNLAPEMHGQNLMARWRSRFGDGSPWQLQAYAQAIDRDDVNLFRYSASTWDVQFTHEPKFGPGRMLWGAGVRRSRDENAASAILAFVPATRKLTWSNVFAQYQWQAAERLQLTAGLKVERNSFTGTELLPSVRAAWMHSPQATTWAAVSRVVRAPARVDRDVVLSIPGLGPLIVGGGEGFESEKANVIEIGHRGQWGDRLGYSATVFRQHFKGLRAGRPGEPLPNVVRNLVEGAVDGIEAWAKWQATGAWQLSAGYLALHKDLRFSGGLSPATRSFPGLGNDPRSQVMLRSSLDIGQGGEFDVLVRRVGELTDPRVPGYASVDARLAFQLTPSFRLALLGTNLLDRRHVEFQGGSEIRRRLLLQATWQL